MMMGLISRHGSGQEGGAAEPSPPLNKYSSPNTVTASLHVLAEEMSRLYEKLLWRFVSLHPKQAFRHQTIANRGAFGVDDRHGKLRELLLQRLIRPDWRH